MRRKVNNRGKRNPVFRFVLAKSDKDEIAAWNRDLDRLLHIFNVRQTSPVGDRQTCSNLFQTELAIDTNIRVANTEINVTNTQTIVANTEIKVTNTQTMVADIHQKLTGQKSVSGQNDSVGATWYR